MFNHGLREHSTLAFLILLLVLSLQGCATRSALMIHPQSGSTIRCGATGTGILAGSAAGLIEECIRDYESRGYVPMEKLTQEQRADLKRRGLLPKEEEPRPRMGGY